MKKNAKETYGMLQIAFVPSCMNRAWVFEWHKRLKEGREPVRDERCGRGKEVNTPGFKGVQEEASSLLIGSVAFPPGQCTSRQLSFSQTIWPRWASTQLLCLPRVQTLLRVTSVYFLTPEAVVMRQLRWKRLWLRSLTRSHKRTSMGPSRSCWNGTSALSPQEITSKGSRVSCVYYQ